MTSKVTPKASTIQEAIDAIWLGLGIDAESEKIAFATPNPTHLIMLDLIPGVVIAKNRIIKAIENKERIMVFGDFDADGVTSTSVLVHGLRSLGSAISYRIPDRNTDSHGLKKYIIDEIAKTGTTLIITVDCGTNDHQEVAHAASLGLDVIITDHHHADPERKPQKAVVVVNPQVMKKKNELQDLAGVGVAFSVLRSVAKSILDKTEVEAFLKRYYELVAIGTIADCMPLRGINRTLCQMGMRNMQDSSWKGIKQMLGDKDGEIISAGTISFTLSPMINAGSRLGDVRHAVQVFLGEDGKTAQRIAYLKNLNDQRKALTKQFLDKAKQGKMNEGAVCLYLPDCPVGICGLVAGKLTEELKKPSIVMTKTTEGKISASCRSPKGGDLAGATKLRADLFLSFGGHDQASGFLATEDKIEEITTHFLSHYKDFKAEKVELEITANVDSADVFGLPLVEFIASLEPFGLGNPSPIWGISKAKLISKELMGKEKNHLRLLFEMTDGHLPLLGFFRGDLFPKLKENQEYELKIEAEKGSWNGQERVELRLKEIVTSK